MFTHSLLQSFLYFFFLLFHHYHFLINLEYICINLSAFMHVCIYLLFNHWYNSIFFIIINPTYILKKKIVWKVAILVATFFVLTVVCTFHFILYLISFGQINCLLLLLFFILLFFPLPSFSPSSLPSFFSSCFLLPSFFHSFLFSHLSFLFSSIPPSPITSPPHPSHWQWCHTPWPAATPAAVSSTPRCHFNTWAPGLDNQNQEGRDVDLPGAGVGSRVAGLCSPGV